MKKRELAAAACWVALGLVISLWSATFPFGTAEAVGPAVLPCACGLILVLLGSVHFNKVWRENAGIPERGLAPLIPAGVAFRRVATTLGGMLVSALLLDLLGFIVTVFAMTLILLRGVQPQKWSMDILYALVISSGCYLFFRVLLNTTLPRGILGF